MEGYMSVGYVSSRTHDNPFDEPQAEMEPLIEVDSRININIVRSTTLGSAFFFKTCFSRCCCRKVKAHAFDRNPFIRKALPDELENDIVNMLDMRSLCSLQGPLDVFEC